MISYIDTIQVLLSTFTVVGLSYFTSFLKLFNVQEISTLRRTIFLVAMPGMIFHRIALREISYETWQPLIHAICTQATLHLLILIVVYCIPSGNKFVMFLQSIFSCTYSSFFYAYPIIQILYGNDYLFIPVVASIVHFLIMNPLHTILIFKEDTNEDHSLSDHQNEEDELEDGIEDGAGGPIHPVETTITKEADNANKIPKSGSDNSLDETSIQPKDPEQPQINSSQKINKLRRSSSISEILTVTEFEQPETYDYPDELDSSVEEIYEDEVVAVSTKEKPKKLLWKSFLFSLLSPLNICTLIGLIWSIPHWDMPLFIEKFVNYLEVAVPATGLACIGVFLWEHPFFGCNWLEVGIYLCVHFIVLPILAAIWAWILKLDKTMASIVTLINVAPASLTGYVMTINCGYGMKSASFTFFWSNLLFIPVFMIWVLAINKIHLFDN
ncbi:Auxin Efflux Carrier family protein [Tritrichomonas foetus]|uniref:Auxin Efflux Carrier family protein n=1 Tax=Tritrichomonas foetus TaxID=1144522 RepID=A0A1J4KNS4_9EUKA|nr:Auxin Efflux Carrier family protein [Tritrichomonas foetus]|eukprot:OHT12576.1 Auxin Efflux Carrier family protein [Tritrichomonas foetus]